MLDDLNALRSLQAEPSARQSVASTKSTCDDQPLPPIFANCLPEFREVILECRDLATEALNYGLAIAQDSGTFNFSREHFSIQDRVTVTYEGKTLYDSGCTGGTDSVAIPYSGDLTKVVVEVEPNCAGTTGTAWNFSVSCPQ